ncbi:uncharacterized protein LOC133526878 [Cydia pomonella]|uniref:uncharacterized protein LOC133526878 n=1 Tax=Cydia pomonella TaxID=82600 RepID=UPI002ADDBA6C|nr:uncharacterized protein LOC133526878 [Cydia pomonella]
MLISRVPDEGAGRGEPAEVTCNGQTASELFELMTKDHDFEAGDDPLTTSDLVLLYKNIDLGTQLMSNVRERPNQYVENVYHDDTETDSDLGESCSSEELRNIMLANKERIDLFTTPPSLNSLCHKLGDLEIQVSNISNDLYVDRHFLKRDPYIKEQLQNLQLMSKANEFNTMLPASLLDYICCKRLEDNYNFYMDDIITYVKHTIDQLKRISNGDYLPEKVKKKWRESDPKSIENSSKILTTSISMPLQVKQKTTGMTPVWDEIVHTEMDLRSLVKIMEKKIVLEVPRMISDSYKFFSRYSADKLVMSCSRRQSEGERSKMKSRVDVVLSVQRAAAGQLVSNIHSIMVLQPECQTSLKDCTEVMPLEYPNPEHADELIPKVIELPEMQQNTGNRSSPQSDEFGSICSISDVTDSKESDCKSKEDSDSLGAVPRPGSPDAMAQILTTAARVVRAEAASNHATPNDLTFSMTTMKPQTSLPEQNTSDSFYAKPKKKSPERARIKSPYENKSFILEERRRRKLLEVKERRERRKMASNENSKVAKHKPFPQAVSSVTKLSITNKAFYNSIYGRNGNGENNKRKSTTTINVNTRKGAQKIDEEVEESEEDVEREEVLPDKTFKKISKGHFLDDTETEMSYLQSKHDSDFLRISTSTSVNSNESITNLYSQSECCSPLMSVKVNGQESATPVEKQRVKHEVEIIKPKELLKKEPTDTTKVDNDKAPALECRRSLEKIYTLMKKLQQIETSETTKKKALASESRGLISESGSSLKRRVSFSNQRLEKLTDRSEKSKERCEDSPTAAVPKVVISVKPQTKLDEKSRSKAKSPRAKLIPENPLKAISQLLHDIDNVQKSRPKIADPKSINRSISTENEELKIQKRRSRIGSPAIEEPKVTAKVKTRFVRQEKPEVVKPQALEKKINDLIDEAKEARGEAVRGPPRFSSRLHALAQPKRAYVQALAGELPKRQTPERVQRAGSHYSRTRRRADRLLSPSSVRAPHSSLERTTKPRRSTDSSPERRRRESPQFGTLAAAAADALQTIKKKVAVEPAGGRCSAEPVAITRAPLLPCDVDLSSRTSCTTDDAQSSSIGLKLHHMVNDMLCASRPSHATADVKEDPSPPFAATACDVKPTETQTATEEIFVENTAIEEIFTANNEPSYGFENAVQITPANSVTELEELEHALHRSLSSGTFAGRLRVNKLTLSPRPSLQRVVMHQSGDTTLVLKSHLTQKIQVTCQSSDQERDLMGLLSKTRLNCGFSGFPFQISTVGYAFPTFKCEIKNIMPRIVNRDMFDTSDAGTSCTDSEETVLEIKAEKGENTSQCLADEECITRQAAETNLETDISSVAAAIAGSGNKEVTASLNKIDCQSSDYTSSFDILVGLLNEIQKITTCGSDATSAQTLESLSNESSPGDSAADRPPSSGDAVSNSCMSSDDPLGSFIPETKSVSAEAVELKPECEDKEVLVRVAPKQVAASTSQQVGFSNGIETSTCTDLPTSSCSVSAFTHSEYCDIACNTLIQSGDKITEQMGMETNRTSVKSLVPYYNNIFKVEMKKEATLLPLTHSVATGTKRNVAAVCNILVDIAPVQKSKRVLNKCEEVKMVNDKKEVNKFSLNVGELDSTLKVKRDILVTFYSILVLTVFAALAFPEMLQYA